MDAVSPVDLGNVVLPPVDESRGAVATECWSDVALASLIESEAIDALEGAISARIPAGQLTFFVLRSSYSWCTSAPDVIRLLTRLPTRLPNLIRGPVE